MTIRLALLDEGDDPRAVAWLVERINGVTPRVELVGPEDAEYFVVASPDPAIKRAVVAELPPGTRFAVLVDPSLGLGGTAAFGPGTVVHPYSRSNVDVDIGRHVTLLAGCMVGRESTIGDFATIGPGAVLNGTAVIGAGAVVGARAAVLEGRRVGAGAVVCSRAVVTVDVPDRATVAGAPARVVLPGTHVVARVPGALR